MGKFLVGWAELSLVPDKKIALAGQFYERIAEYVETEITATAMAVESEGQKAIFVSCDLTGLYGDVLQRTRRKFAALTAAVSPDCLIINATHTHTSIKYTPTGHSPAAMLLNEFLPADRQYTPLVQIDDSILSPEEGLEWLSDRISLVAKQAWDNRAEAMYANAFGRAAVGFCRRVSYDDGSGKMWGDTNTANFVSLEGGNDSGIELLYMFDREKKLTGVVANVACPSQILEHRSFISSDYWGKVKAHLRKAFGEHIYLLALCGAGGDQCPRDLVRWVNPETPINDPNIVREHYIERTADPSMFDLSGCRLVGKRIANEIISVYEEITQIKADAPFTHEVLTLPLPLRKATVAEYNQAVREVEYYIDKNKDKAEFNYKDAAAMHVHLGTILRYRQQQNQELVPTEVHILRLGDVAFATNPFELFLDYGNYIKARSLARQTFIIQLCSGNAGYLPTEKAEKAGHYSAYISSGTVGHEGGNLLARASVEEINKLFS